jgi:cytosine permease
MPDFQNLVEDYATTPVPQRETYSGVRVGFVLGGIGIALPALLSGAEVGLALGYRDSIAAFIVAGVLVTVLSTITGWVGMRSRLSTYMILRFSFGALGARLVSLTFALAQFGWFGVNAFFFGTAAYQLGRDTLGWQLPPAAYIVAGGVVMTGATIFGFKALDKLALVVFPLMLTVLAMMVARTFDVATLDALTAMPGTGEMTFGQSVTALAGGIIVGVLLVPDLTRYARGPRDVVIASLIALALIEPLVHVAAAGPAIALAEQDPLALMLGLGLGAVALAFLILTSITTNAVNLYGSGLALAAVFPRTPEWLFVILAGVVGTALALLDIGTLFVDFLVWQSVIFSSVLGVYVVDFFVVRRGDYRLAQLDGEAPVSWAALTAWMAGAAIAAATFLGMFSITGMSNLDGVLTGASVYATLELPAARRRAASAGA